MDMADWRNTSQIARADGQVEYHYRKWMLSSSLSEFRHNALDIFSVGRAEKTVDRGPGAPQLFLSRAPATWMSPSAYGAKRWGFWVGEKTVSGTFGRLHDWRIAIPQWAWILFFGLLPGARGMLSFWRSHKREVSLCRRCGYDLRESKERCPECGLVVERPAKRL